MNIITNQELGQALESVALLRVDNRSAPVTDEDRGMAQQAASLLINKVSSGAKIVDIFKNTKSASESASERTKSERSAGAKAALGFIYAHQRIYLDVYRSIQQATSPDDKQAIRQVSEQIKETRHTHAIDAAGTIEYTVNFAEREESSFLRFISTSKTGEKSYKLAALSSSLAIMPILLMKPTDDLRNSGHQELVTFLVKGMDYVSTVTIPSKALSSPSAHKKDIERLARCAIPTREKIVDAKGHTFLSVMEMVVALMKKQGYLPIKTGSIKSGWHIDDSTNYIQHIIPGCEGYVGQEDPVHIEVGSKEEALKFYRKTLKENPRVAMLAGIAAAGLMRAVIMNVDNKIIHLYGDSSSGKTLLLRFISGMIGDTGDVSPLIESWDQSATSLENILQRFTHAFVSFDEVHQLIDNRAINPRKIIMQMANGSSRGRGRVDGGSRERKGWNTTIFSTGNTPIDFDEITQSDAVEARVINIQSRDLWATLDRGSATEAQEFLANNHGWMYKPMIESIKRNRERYKLNFRAYNQKITDLTNANGTPWGNVIGRKATGFASALVGIDLLQDTLGLERSDLNLAREMTRNEIEKLFNFAKVQEDTKLLDLMNEIRGLIGSNFSSCRIKDRSKTGLDDDGRQANWSCIIESNNFSVDSDWSGTFFIAASKISNQNMREQVINLAKAANEEGLLVRQPGQGDKLVINKKGLGTCYAFKVKSDKDLDELISMTEQQTIKKPATFGLCDS